MPACLLASHQGPLLYKMVYVVEDILWFKPVELKTKQGKRGHIKEALGKLVMALVVVGCVVRGIHRHTWTHEVCV